MEKLSLFQLDLTMHQVWQGSCKLEWSMPLLLGWIMIHALSQIPLVYLCKKIADFIDAIYPFSQKFNPQNLQSGKLTACYDFTDPFNRC